MIQDELRERALAVPLQTITTRALAKIGIELLLRRDDLIDEQISGNKFYKLFYNLVAAKEQGYSQLVSFGGAYSNHLHALAAAGHKYGFQTLGVVRGERPAVLSPSLQDAEAWGMRLVFVAREVYRDLQSANPSARADEFKGELTRQYGDGYWIPEGGANTEGALGMKVLGQAIEQQLRGGYTSVCLACGTGTSLAGVAAGIAPQRTALGFSVLKGDGGLGGHIADMYKGLRELEAMGNQPTVLPQASNWRLISGFHAGGYAKKHPDYLYRFWRDFEQDVGVALDPVYTVKLLWGITQLAEQGYWSARARIVAVHTGGLQGRRGFRAP